jgi:hypothetical protein
MIPRCSLVAQLFIHDLFSLRVHRNEMNPHLKKSLKE